MSSRRRFLERTGLLAAGGLLGASSSAGVIRAMSVAASPRHAGMSPYEAAVDEDFWSAIQKAFTVDRSLIDLNSGAVSPSPLTVQESMRGYLEISNRSASQGMIHQLEPQRERVRRGLAKLFGCSQGEVAITRNSTEGLNICQLGHDLKEGDEVLTTDQDYHRMIAAWRQMEQRKGIILRQIQLPVPSEDPAQVVDRFRQAISERTRLILMCHVVNLTGQILPVRDVVQMARSLGIPVIVDGAHSFAQLDFQHDDLDCDYYATSLHKWLFAPHGTGLLYVRKDKIADLWPLIACPYPQLRWNIRKFEEVGTHPAANFLAIWEALAFHQRLGAARKAARLRYLKTYWAKRLLESDRVRLNTSLKPQFSCGIASFRVDGLDSKKLARQLWIEHRILLQYIGHQDCPGIRVTPSVYTTLDELDRFCDAVEGAIRDGLSSS